MPAWLEGFAGLSRETWMQVTAVLEIIFGLLVLVPHRNIRRLGALLMALHLVAVLTQTGWNDIAVRDIGLLASSIALLLLL